MWHWNEWGLFFAFIFLFCRCCHIFQLLTKHWNVCWKALFFFCLLKLINYCKILSLNTALPYSMSYLLSMPASGRRRLRLASSGYHWAALRHSGSPGLTTNSHKHLLPSQSTIIWKPSWSTRCWINFICPSVDLKLWLHNLNDIHWYDHCSQTLAQTHAFLDFPWHPHIVPFYLLMTTAFLPPPLFLWSLGWYSEFPQIRSILGFIHPLPHHVLIRLSGHAFSLRSLACTFQPVWQKTPAWSGHSLIWDFVIWETEASSYLSCHSRSVSNKHRGGKK